jgi:hypothetical protein
MMNNKLFELSKRGGWRHFIYVIYGRNYFFPHTRNYWIIGSWNNGAVHAFKKPQIGTWLRLQRNRYR